MLKSGSWKRIGYPILAFNVLEVLGNMVRVIWHLNLHGAFIVSFNISNEVCGEIPLLKQMFDKYSAYCFMAMVFRIGRNALLLLYIK